MDHLHWQKNLAPILRPLSGLYAACMRLRARAYASGLLKSASPHAFCVAVGNIAWGGSGKTPLTGWLADWAHSRGLSPAILSRGYGGKSPRRPLPVTPHTSPQACGDEPLLLARTHPHTTVLADPSRRRALAWLRQNSRADFIILDDAMQHLAVKRHLNLTLLRPQDLNQDWGKVIPLGPWRESPQALERADAFILRAAPGQCAALMDAAAPRLPANKPVFSFDLYPLGLRPVQSGLPCSEPSLREAQPPSLRHSVPSPPCGLLYPACGAEGPPDPPSNSSAAVAAEENLNGFPKGQAPLAGVAGAVPPASFLQREALARIDVYTLCTGVGNPASVRQGATTLLGRPPEKEFIFPDHHPYSRHDLCPALAGGHVLVITPKDEVKLAPLLGPEEAGRCLVLESGLRFGPFYRSGLGFADWLAAQYARENSTGISFSLTKA